MNRLPAIAAILCIALCSRALAQTQDMDTELSGLADKLASQVKDQGKKKVAVIDFSDLQGNSDGELGKYIAEQLTVDLVMVKRDFAVLDRANLRKILAEHKLTSQGLVDPENAKKLGQFAGVDALILGTIIPKGPNISLNAKIITTDTAEIVGAARAEFKSDGTVQQLVAAPVTATDPSSGAGNLADDKPKVVKSLGDLRAELQTLRIVNGREFLLTITLSNQNTKKSVWVALNTDMGSNVKGSLTDSNGGEFRSAWYGISGIEFTPYQNGGFSKATEIKPSDSITATVKFSSLLGRPPAPGICSLQLEFLVGNDFSGGFGFATVQNLVCKIGTN